MPADILLFALIAAGLIFWLRSILGKRDEDEDYEKPSLNYEDPDDKTKSLLTKKNSNGNVVPLNVSLGDKFALPRHVRIDNKTTENKLEDIARDYPQFDLGHFVQGAEMAFPMIVEAFADGDLDTLKNLLAPEVYRAFEAAVKDRKERGETIETKIVAVEKIDITHVDIQEGYFFLTVRFSARETCVIRDKNDNIISGDPDKTTVMVDVWVFGRDIDSKGPEWYLYETRDDEIEDHKTPIPEGGSEKEKK